MRQNLITALFTITFLAHLGPSAGLAMEDGISLASVDNSADENVELEDGPLIQPSNTLQDEPAKKQADEKPADQGPESSPAKTAPNTPAAPEITKADPSNEKAGLTIASWGGAYAEAQKRAYIIPFGEKTGVDVTVINHQGKFAPVTDTDGNSGVNWNIVDLDYSSLEAGCSNGSLNRIEATHLASAPDGSSPTDDFLNGALHECGIASVAWSATIVFDKRAFKRTKPKSSADFFNVTRFPGARAIPESPKYIMELALLADGADPDEIYSLLETEEGLERALKQLNRLKDNVLFWRRASEPLVRLSEKNAAIALAFNGRIFSSIVTENKPFSIIWDSQLYQFDYWAIPKASKDKAQALNFISFATQPDRLAHQASWFPYGPARKSAISLVGKHPEIDIEMKRFLPTAPDNFKNALRVNPVWWEDNGARAAERYRDWVKKIKDSADG